MKDKPAKPIWLPEEAPVASAIFETDFTLDTEFKQGSIEFIAPENLAVYLNGDEIASNLALEYDPDPLMVYSSELTLDPSKVKPGKNTLRFVVTNASAYRGFEAAVTIVKAGKEDIR